jgi:hypothetical protein
VAASTIPASVVADLYAELGPIVSEIAAFEREGISQLRQL